MGQALNQQEFREIERINENLKHIDSTLKKIHDIKRQPPKNPQLDELISVLKEINVSLKAVSTTIKDESTKNRAH